MINPMNDRDPKIKHTTLHGNHEANNVYCKDLVFKPGAGKLFCNDIFLDPDWSEIDVQELNFDDRCYSGILYVEDAWIGDVHSGLTPQEEHDGIED